jgi:monooxygenase
MSNETAEHLDVLIIGAGISGIGAARYLITELPGKSFAILEGRAAIGGTWDLFKYPGLRSDSDLHTFGYEFKPWTDENAIASADKILAYLGETVEENGIAPHIRFGHKVVSVAWSSADARWTVQIDRAGEAITLTANWLFGATGYYDYDSGFSPRFEGVERFTGTVVHPQQWPEDLDYRGKKIVVIGSGATAVTLIPALADGGAGHVTMLQRTPSYILPIPAKDGFAIKSMQLLGDHRGYALTRRKNILRQWLVYTLCQKFPDRARKVIRAVNAKQLPEGFDVDKHFNPPYDPWDQRLCAVPNGDLFRAIRHGKASVATDRIETFTENGIRLASGEELEADIIVTATGLNLKLFGGMSATVDGEPVVPTEKIAYKGMMLSGVPNFAFAIGYTNSSWTLKVGLLCEHFVRLLKYMDGNGYVACTPVAPAMPTRPLMDFAAGYVQRSLDTLPRQGSGAPWAMSMSYREDVKLVRGGDVVDEFLSFAKAPAVTG